MNQNFGDFFARDCQVRDRLCSLFYSSLTVGRAWLRRLKHNQALKSKTKSGSQSAHGDQAAGASPAPRIPAHFSSVDEARSLQTILASMRFSEATTTG
jgi:hypothetical protein